MAEGPLSWLKTLWAYVDERLASLSRTLQRVVRTLRVVHLLLIVGVVLVLASAIIGVVAPRYFPYAHLLATLFLVIPLVVMVLLVGLPLRMHSVVRLIDQGYPDNARELAIRVAARKLRDQSIETEELLVETAVNEGRKAYAKYQQRAAELEQTKAAMDAAIADAERPGRNEPPSV